MVYLYEIIFKPQNGRKNINDYCIITDLEINNLAALLVDKYGIYDAQRRRHVCIAVEYPLKHNTAKDKETYKLLFGVFTQNWTDSNKKIQSLAKTKETLIGDIMRFYQCSKITADLHFNRLNRRGYLHTRLVSQYNYDYLPAFPTFRR